MSLRPWLPEKLWPYHPHPRPDELLSSWLMRFARGNSIKLHTASKMLFGEHVQVWNRDIDSTATSETIRQLADATGTAYDLAFATSLRAYEGVLYPHHNTQGANRWILPVGVYHRTRRRLGLTFCPLCLRDDGDEPYFRRRWRLAFYTVCDKHKVLMQESCPYCGGPVVPFRREIGSRTCGRIDELTLCSFCGYDLRYAGAYGAPGGDPQVLTTFISFLMFFDIGWWFLSSGAIVWTLLYLDGVHRLMQYLASNKGAQLRNTVVRDVGAQIEATKITHQEYHSLGVLQRHYLLIAAMWLLTDWPARFVAVAQSCHVRASDLWRDSALPFWLHKVVYDHLHRPAYLPTETEIACITRYLVRQHIPISRSAICKVLGQSHDCNAGIVASFPLEACH